MTNMIMIAGILAVSWAGPLIRAAEPASALAIAFWRTSAAGVVLLSAAALTLRRGQLSATRRMLVPLMLAGVFLAIHFASWIASIGLTTIASSVLLVSSAPIWAAIGSRLMGERLNALTWSGIALAVAGGALVAGGGLDMDIDALRGNVLALVGAISLAAYLIVGRIARVAVPLPLYAGSVYAFAALIIGISALVTSTSVVSIPSHAWTFIALIAIGPQLIGHTIFNFLLKDLEAFKVAVVAMGEPIGAAAIAAVMFGEVPSGPVVPGALLLLTGILLTLVSRPEHSSGTD